MDLQTLWIVVLSIATPVAGVVGFSVQLRQVKKARLENEKLELEIRALREQMAQSEQLIIKPTNEEVIHINHGGPRYCRVDRVLESRGITGDSTSDETPPYKTPLKERMQVAAFVIGFVMFVAYFLFDVFRLLAWFASWF